MNSPLLEILERLGGESRIHYSLDHFRRALEAVGNPHESVKTIVISGTNGKGSVALFLSSVLAESGLNVGTYLSPHLQHPQERFLQNLQPADWNELEALALPQETVAERFGLTYFEYLTLTCFLWAQAKRFDYLVLEVGMGGRLDATNVTQPQAGVITNIDWDHQKYLGDTLELILEEKMGVLRPGLPTFTGIHEAPLMAYLEQGCRKLAIEPQYTCLLPRMVRHTSWDGQEVRIDGHTFHLTNPSVGTFANAGLAYSVIRKIFPSIPIMTIQNGFSRVRTPGRLETVALSPRVVLSGDHNPAGIRCLQNTLNSLNCRPKTVCGFSPDKPHREMIEKLGNASSELILTQISRFQGKMPYEYPALAEFVYSPVEAVREMLKRCSVDDTLLITGSLYLIGELRGLWRPQTSFLVDDPKTFQPSPSVEAALI